MNEHIGVLEPKAEVRQPGDVPSFLRIARPIQVKGCLFVAHIDVRSGREVFEKSVLKPMRLLNKWISLSFTKALN